MNRSPFHDGVTIVSLGNSPALIWGGKDDVAGIVAEEPPSMNCRPLLAHRAVQEIRIGVREPLLEMNARTPTERADL